MLSQLRYVDDLVRRCNKADFVITYILNNNTKYHTYFVITCRLCSKFRKWKENGKSKDLLDCPRKGKVMVNEGIIKVVFSKGNVYPYGICGLMVKANSVLCVQCAMWISSRCAGLTIVDSNFQEIFTAGNMKETLERHWKMEKNYLMKWKQ